MQPPHISMASNNPNQNSSPLNPPLSHPPPSRRAAPACAACKHQRRRCSEQCLLLPYFPSHKAKEFYNVHKLFGINNIVKLLEKVPNGDRDDAMKSVIYEANIRAINPVGGCAAVIRHLQNEVDVRANELNAVCQNLALLREGNLETIRVSEQMQQLGITDQFGGNLGPNLINDQFVGKLSQDLVHDESDSSLIHDPDRPGFWNRRN